MRKLYSQHKQKIDYLLVGGWNTVFGYSVFVLLYYLFGSQLHYLWIFLISNVLSITNAYIGYKVFVFKTKGNVFREYLRFYLVYLSVIAVNFILLPVCVEGLHLSPPIAQGGLMFLNVAISYIGHKKYSFNHNEQ